MSRFFIHRPIFASVISIIIVIAGLAAMRTLPIAQYPEITPPMVTVQAFYPGASAQVLEQLAEVGVQYAQGHYIASPQPVEALAALVARPAGSAAQDGDLDLKAG